MYHSQGYALFCYNFSETMVIIKKFQRVDEVFTWLLTKIVQKILSLEGILKYIGV